MANSDAGSTGVARNSGGFAVIERSLGAPLGWQGRFLVKRMILAPHCDDETLGCGGLLAKYPSECGVVVIARPDDVRRKEFNEAKEILGYADCHLLNFQDGRVGDDARRLVNALDAVVGEWRPQELYVPYPSTHQDHIHAYEAGIRAARLSMSGHWFTPSVYVYDVAAYDLSLYPTDLRWNIFESLDEAHVDKKVQALETYASQAVMGPHPANGMKQMAQACGNARGVDWAEPYALVREVRS